MIGIDMELPKSCKECETFGNEVVEDNNNLNLKKGDIVCSLLEKIDVDRCVLKNGIKLTNCPLVDLDKEDMDFEDLKEKCKNISTGNYNHYFSVRIDSGTIFSFYETGIISIEQENDLTKDDYIEIFNKTPFEMYQIIKSLVGDER